MSLGFVVSHPIQYFSPLFRSLSREPGVRLRVYYLRAQASPDAVDPEFGVEVRWDTGLLGGYDHEVVGSDGAAATGRSIRGALAREQHDALVVHGYNTPPHRVAISAARSTGTPLVLRGESHLLDPRPRHVRLLKRLALPRLLRGATCAAIGSLNEAFYLHYGVPRERMVRAPYAVDNEYFLGASRALEGQRRELRARWSVEDDRPLVLFAGKLVPKKSPGVLLEAFAAVRRQRPCALLFAGDGPLRGSLEERVRSGRIPDVRFAGFLNQSQMPWAYAAADLLVLPSAWGETWGLAVNEAMNFGLPVIVSDRVGCAPDLVEHGVNGAVVPPANPQALASVLGGLLSRPEGLQEMGRRSRARIAGWGVPNASRGIVCAAALAGGRAC